MIVHQAYWLQLAFHVLDKVKDLKEKTNLQNILLGEIEEASVDIQEILGPFLERNQAEIDKLEQSYLTQMVGLTLEQVWEYIDLAEIQLILLQVMGRDPLELEYHWDMVRGFKKFRIKTFLTFKIFS